MPKNATVFQGVEVTNDSIPRINRILWGGQVRGSRWGVICNASDEMSDTVRLLVITKAKRLDQQTV